MQARSMRLPRRRASVVLARLASALGVLCLSSLFEPTVTSAVEPFTVIALPDTQNYSEFTPATFIAQTQWIADEAAARNIQYVAHLGDFVEHGPDLREWGNAAEAMDILDGAGIPYGTCMGNHDNHYNSGEYQYPPQYYVPTFDHYEDPGGEHYQVHFGSEFYDAEPWYGGASSSGLSNYQIIPAGGYDFLFVNLSIDTPPAELSWAQDVLGANRDKPAVISTHRYMYDYRLFAGRYGEDAPPPFTGFTGGEPDYDPDRVMSQNVYEDLVAQNPNIFMVQCGHHHSEFYRTDGVNGAGRPVVEILTDYQESLNGGNGWLRIYEFDVDAGRINASTYSPTLNRYRSTFDDYFETMLMIPQYKQFLKDNTGWSDALVDAYLDQLKEDEPGLDLTQHPDYAAILPAYEPYLLAAYEGEVPVMEGLWMQAFASNPLDPFGGGPRDPSFTLDVDFDAYVVPEPSTLALLLAAALPFAAAACRSRVRPFARTR